MVREIGFRTRGGSIMVPDAAVVVMPLDGEPRLWPTIVVEVTNSQGYDDVLAKVKRWFSNSRGMVEVVFVLKFTAKDPIPDPPCFLEVWRYEVSVGDLMGDGLVVPDGETIDSAGLGDSGGDGDEHADLANSDYAGGTPSPSSVVNGSDRDNENEQDISIAVVDPCAPHDINSDSSLTSLNDEETDIPLVPPEAHSPSSSSASSTCTSEYRTGLRSRKRQIFLSGPRITILPVVDPESRYLNLRYSDFFSMENVPEGRAADEPVQLDLDELRLEIRLLMRMTERMEENVKKHAGAESGGGGKRVKR